MRTIQYIPDGSIYQNTEDQKNQVVALCAAAAKDAEDFVLLLSALGMEIA